MGGLYLALGEVVMAVASAILSVNVLHRRQTRRKLEADATATDATAASTLSGAAIRMVESYQAKEHHAEERVHTLQEQHDRDLKRMQDLEWRLYHLTVWTTALVAALEEAGIVVPAQPVHLNPPVED